MTRYAVLSRLTAPAMIVLTGVLALLNEANILSWSKSWPLYLITLGVLRLAQRTALREIETEAGYPGYPVAGYPVAGPYPPPPPAPAPATTSVVPAPDPNAPDWRP